MITTKMEVKEAVSTFANANAAATSISCHLYCEFHSCKYYKKCIAKGKRENVYDLHKLLHICNMYIFRPAFGMYCHILFHFFSYSFIHFAAATFVLFVSRECVRQCACIKY